jgi:hypothetical protein
MEVLQTVLQAPGTGSPEAALFLISRLNLMSPQINKGMAKTKTMMGITRVNF